MERTPATSAGRQAGRREWIGLLVLALPCLLYSMDLTILNLAVPHLTAALRPTGPQLLWIVDIYGFMLAGSLITMGALGDRIGRRRLLLIGAAAFGIASILAALSSSAEMLIATRALLGVAAATLAPSTLSLIRNMFHDERQRNVAIGVFGASFSVGGAIGPLIGGVLLEHFWWGSAFLVAVPPMIVLLVLGPRLLPEFRDPNAGRPDVVSAGLSLVGVLAVIFGLKQIAQDGVSPMAILSILGGVTIGTIFLRRQRTLGDPLIDLGLFRAAAFSASISVLTLTMFVTFGTMLLMAQFLQLVAGLSPFEAGLWMLPSGGGAVAGSLLVPVVLRRTRPAVSMIAGLSIMAIAFGLLTQVDGAAGLGLVVAASVSLTFGGCLAGLAATGLVIGAAPPERAGAAAAISQTGAELGGALGIAVLGSIATAVYRGQIVQLIPAGLAPAAGAGARDTLGGAVGVASGLPGDLGATLLDAARMSFSQGIQVASIVSLVIAIGLALVAAVSLWKPAGSASAAELGPQTASTGERGVSQFERAEA
jgi:DHA2 family multidrug resistance protein-like MFS transporter